MEGVGGKRKERGRKTTELFFCARLATAMDANADMCSTCRFPAKTSNGMLVRGLAMPIVKSATALKKR